LPQVTAELAKLVAQLAELAAQAEAGCRRSQELAEQPRRIERKTRANLELLKAASARADKVRELWLSDAARQHRRHYAAAARLTARLATLPAIEQAKGILMAQSGWSEAEAFDALRRASQQSNTRCASWPP
jgi:hypothetical protein